MYLILQVIYVVLHLYLYNWIIITKTKKHLYKIVLSHKTLTKYKYYIGSHKSNLYNVGSYGYSNLTVIHPPIYKYPIYKTEIFNIYCGRLLTQMQYIIIVHTCDTNIIYIFICVILNNYELSISPPTINVGQSFTKIISYHN